MHLGKEGTAALLAELLQKGAGSRDAATFAATVEGVGAQLKAGASREALVLGASFLSKDTDLMLGLLGDMLMRPQLDPAEFDKARELAVQSIAAAKDSDPSALIGDYGAAWLFGQHAYGRPDGGDPASLEAIRLDDVKRYYTEQIGGDRLLIAVVGAVSSCSSSVPVSSPTLNIWRAAPGNSSVSIERPEKPRPSSICSRASRAARGRRCCSWPRWWSSSPSGSGTPALTIAARMRQNRSRIAYSTMPLMIGIFEHERCFADPCRVGCLNRHIRIPPMNAKSDAVMYHRSVKKSATNSIILVGQRQLGVELLEQRLELRQHVDRRGQPR